MRVTPDVWAPPQCRENNFPRFSTASRCYVLYTKQHSRKGLGCSDKKINTFTATKVEETNSQSFLKVKASLNRGDVKFTVFQSLVSRSIVDIRAYPIIPKCLFSSQNDLPETKIFAYCGKVVSLNDIAAKMTYQLFCHVVRL